LRHLIINYLTITILPMHQFILNTSGTFEEKLRPSCRALAPLEIQDDISPRTRPQAQPGAAALQKSKWVRAGA
jgi:hypothetical protein